MVRLAAPPPRRPPSPLIAQLPAGTRLVRLFDPEDHGARALSFRSFGPIHRFDHHTVVPDGPADDPHHGVWYGAPRLRGSVVEVFGDTGIVTWGTWQVAVVTTIQLLILLDVRGNGAMRAGTVAALCKTPDRSLSQAWGRFFSSRTDLYHAATGEAIHGLFYNNAHNDDAVCLYERAEHTLTCSTEAILSLADPALYPLLVAVGHECHLTIPPAPRA